MSICIQSAGGCSHSPCSFGCNPLGSRGFSCDCPLGYQSVGDGHCVSTVNPSGFSSTWEFEDEEEEEEYVSTEGCFSCQMNGFPGRSSTRSRKSSKTHRRKSRKRRDRNRRSSNVGLSGKELFSEAEGELSELSSFEAKHFSNNITVHLRVSEEQTRHHLRIAKLQPSRNDLSHSIDYKIISDPSDNLDIKRKAGIWGLYFKRRVQKPSRITARIVGKLQKGPSANHQRDLHALFKIEVI